MSDNSRIVKTNTTIASNVILPSKSHILPKLTPINSLRNVRKVPPSNLVTHYTPTTQAPSFPTRLPKSNPKPIVDLETENEAIEVNCKIMFPKHQTNPAILKFDNGLIMELDRALFSAVEKKVKISQRNNLPKVSSTFLPLKDNPFVKKIKKRKHFIQRPKILSERSLAPGPRFMNILPKPRPRVNNKEVGRLANNPLYTSRQTSIDSTDSIGE